MLYGGYSDFPFTDEEIEEERGHGVSFCKCYRQSWTPSALWLTEAKNYLLVRQQLGQDITQKSVILQLWQQS